jgi:hypothetical protein
LPHNGAQTYPQSPRPVGCENAWHRSITSQQRTGPGIKRLWAGRELSPLSTTAHELLHAHHFPFARTLDHAQTLLHQQYGTPSNTAKSSLNLTPKRDIHAEIPGCGLHRFDDRLLPLVLCKKARGAARAKNLDIRPSLWRGFLAQACQRTSPYQRHPTRIGSTSAGREWTNGRLLSQPCPKESSRNKFMPCAVAQTRQNSLIAPIGQRR